MGITWIIGVLVIEVDELFALAYIFTIFVAFQGIFIFVIFVLLSKQVRENYAKWWKAKVAESDFLSKYFGEKSLSSSMGMVRNKKSCQLGHTDVFIQSLFFFRRIKLLCHYLIVTPKGDHQTKSLMVAMSLKIQDHCQTTGIILQ